MKEPTDNVKPQHSDESIRMDICRIDELHSEIDELTSRIRYLETALDEYECHENKVITELKQANALGSLYASHLRARVDELNTDNTKLRKALASSCDEERSMGIEEGPHHATCGLAQELNARITELQAERDGLSRYIAAGAAWDSPDSLSLQNAQLKARVAELEQQVQLDDKAKRVMVQWSSGEKRELKARIEELEKIVSSCLRELPVGYVQAHTPESIPDRIAYYVQQVTELEAKCASSDALITKMFYAGNTMRDWSQDRGPNWDKCCEIWDKVVEELL